MKTIAFLIQKGGTGKTSISVNLAAEIAKKKKTVLIDTDPQGTASSWLLSESSEKELADVLFEEATAKEAIVPTSCKGLDILPTFAIGGRLSSFIDNAAAERVFAMQAVLKQLSELKYDIAVIDTAPSFTLFARNTLVCCDETVAPVIPDEAGGEGLEIFMENLTKSRRLMCTEKPVFNRIVLNAMDERIAQFKMNADALKQDLKNFTFYTIPTDQAFRKSQSNHITVQEGGAKNETLNELKRLAKDLTGEKK